MTTLATIERAQAYVNHGRWIADCTRPFCASAEMLRPGQVGFHCSNCGLVVDLEWPPDPTSIWSALAARPVPQTRNWFPSEHRLALSAGCPHGQSIADLLAENREYGVA